MDAGKSANAQNIPVIFDLVGAGVSLLHNQAAENILNEIKVNVLRGNISEIRFIAGQASETKGVDALQADANRGNNAKDIAPSLAQRLGSVVAITGKEDIVSDGKGAVRILNGTLCYRI